jgi:Putative Actinobacterial Holin-X, holin superfamily III
MERIFAKTEELVDDVKEYVDLKIESAKLAVAEKTSLIVANAAAGLAVLIAFVFFAVLLVTGLALLIGEWIGKPWAGFMIMALVCLVKAAIIWWARKRIIQVPVMNALIKQLFSNTQDHEED